MNDPKDDRMRDYLLQLSPEEQARLEKIVNQVPSTPGEKTDRMAEITEEMVPHAFRQLKHNVSREYDANDRPRNPKLVWKDRPKNRTTVKRPITNAETLSRALAADAQKKLKRKSWWRVWGSVGSDPTMSDRLPQQNSFVNMIAPGKPLESIPVDEINLQQLTTRSLRSVHIGTKVLFDYTNKSGHFRFTTTCTVSNKSYTIFVIPEKIYEAGHVDMVKFMANISRT